MIQIGKFPDSVNEYAARSVAGLVFLLTIATLLTQSIWLNLALLYGFTARVLYGPKFSIFARLAIHGIVPLLNLGNKTVAGPPKRFAQGVGFLFSLTSLILLIQGQILAFQITLGILIFFTALESFVGFCAGCFVFGYLMQWGIIPQEVCERCSRLTFTSKEPNVY
ncbi:DUF4395 domain-containing protein [Leptospira borgpetersenii]|uniref:PF14340 domain protein n=1 Tax=Leptospira borgpetersenii serovar Pomona str. 200901868 TaxID=1192866 RepID=M6W794_LEPBO|nr:DUF4395 domain-containing protein [Leptospira borgpetersenii]EMO08587.1 PF14340 domain protein [Leptospira borgpetersenii str. Noumea 25]EMO61094.1 PF14340 domain protein [Leptospira borgpetersenii serovar Pomona str. 200901868]EKR02358.1 PF14340 domain protein [Leptospira borgpetersenii serovar Castellonis str. 200801910]KGE24707.1 hypothetical protein IQ66_06785 [Leptospira borgpetersenii serovar Ballum]MBE8162062.1 DUF4395 domain-containing protein [Leptospira borgpetersenii serovar Ball